MNMSMNRNYIKGAVCLVLIQALVACSSAKKTDTAMNGNTTATARTDSADRQPAQIQEAGSELKQLVNKVSKPAEVEKALQAFGRTQKAAKVGLSDLATSSLAQIYANPTLAAGAAEFLGKSIRNAKGEVTWAKNAGIKRSDYSDLGQSFIEAGQTIAKSGRDASTSDQGAVADPKAVLSFNDEVVQLCQSVKECANHGMDLVLTRLNKVKKEVPETKASINKFIGSHLKVLKAKGLKIAGKVGCIDQGDMRSADAWKNAADVAEKDANQADQFNSQTDVVEASFRNLASVKGTTVEQEKATSGDLFDGKACGVFAGPSATE